ncbi:MAG: DNA/RNA helicase domain-containing protein [Pirellulales bacterium]
MSIDAVHWSLDPPSDPRSSLYLEDAATEFQVQGLELDWTKSHVGRRLTLVGERLELSQFPGGEVDRRCRQPQSLQDIFV